MTRLWTFRLSGGNAFDAQVGREGAFPNILAHRGGRGAITLFSAWIPDEEAVHLEASLVAAGISVRRWASEESEEQHVIRARQRSVEAGEVPFRTIRCPSCFWLDIGCANMCGYASWDAPVVQSALDAHARAREDVDACPAYSGRNTSGTSFSAVLPHT